ncbi:pyridoxamine 5'-phosphate oxidase [Streptomyces sp. 1114.5]|uniref:pyridoxamine 5'-phosphate oxidase family protein n=1 Tax=Streptomyces sp. 1114.5 TaxID=1938830 RepID=UPI000F10C29E|nr:pyridoxamine 5'-phosphate oxidase family protein [Streptomyces sp. 1114.5]RKT17037.1 pyridoxamine 5'-phosphate oxidase [Streptomyces sp. 1114.5]
MLISEATLAFLAEPLPIIVGTRRQSGSVKMNPAWFEFHDGYFWFNSWRGAHWLAQVERDRQATLLLMDPQDMYRVVHVETALVATRTEGAGAHLDRLSYRYRGEPYRAVAPMQRVIIQLEPLHVRSTLDGRPRR